MGGGGSILPSHVVINGENLHALQLLEFTHGGKIDAIFIDPPYNTGDKNWKYNNDYVESSDYYRHSKWLAFMERRLKLAKKLLNPTGSVLIVTIDEKEYLRLGLLLEQTFSRFMGSAFKMQMISSVVNDAGRRSSEFGRVNEYIFFLWFGDMDLSGYIESQDEDVRWTSLRRFNTRKDMHRKNQFYPIYVNKKSGLIEAAGEPLPKDFPRELAPKRKGCIGVFPIREEDGEELIWRVSRNTFMDLKRQGYISIGKYQNNKKNPYPIYYLQEGIVKKIKNGEIEKIGKNPHDESVLVRYKESKGVPLKTSWHFPLHNTSASGTKLLKSFVPGCKFPSPKSLYAVEDCLLLFLKNRPNSIVLDFFAGSGTTCHAVMKLNRRFGGQRQSISITNNEVGNDDEKRLSKGGLRPGEPKWDKHGICESVTIPRIKAAITGKTPSGKRVKGNYKIMKVISHEDSVEKGIWKPVDDFPKHEGLQENATFFRLSYESRAAVEQDFAFERIAPLLWMRAGATGAQIDTWPDSGWATSDVYGVIVDLDMSASFLDKVRESDAVNTVFVVTDEEDRFRVLANELPKRVDAVRLWRSYVSTFRRGS